jgi:hypothetical protein
VLSLLEESDKTQPTTMLEMIISRYKEANNIIENNSPENLTKDMFKIRGGVRAYLEAYSDYMNPVLEEMNKAEKMLEEIFR